MRAFTSRRRFLAGGAAAVGAAALAACAPTAAPTATTAPAKPAAPAEPTKPAAPAAAAAPTNTAAPAAAAPAAAATNTPAAAAAAAKPTEAPKPADAAKPAAAAPAAGGTSGEKSDFGVDYPADAAPKDKQFTQTVANPTNVGWKSFDFNDSVYARAPLADFFTEPLIRLDKNWQVVPGLASKWQVSADGKAWTFFLDKQSWSNGDEVTADDFIVTYRYTADPKHAWDFTWYYDGIIKNYTAVVKGTMPATQLGVKQGADKYQVVFETEDAVPYFPQMMVFSWVLHGKSLEKAGSGIYQTNPATCVSCGPYVLEEFSPDRRVTVKSNPKYNGKLKPLINRMVANVVTGAGGDFARYQAGEIDWTDRFTPADLKLIQADANLKAQFKTNPGDFRTYYMFFDVTAKPFDNKNVRLAFAKAIDRESIVKGILAPLGIPAYSFLMPGFPDANSAALKPTQDFNPAQAKALLAEAGFPNGQGFPKQTMLIRGGGPPTDAAVTQAVVASIKQTLGVDIDLQTKDQPAFMADLNAKPTKVPWGWLSYGMDYFDATNLLGVWKSGGRHNWNNAAYDKLVKDGGQITDNAEKRSDMMKQAEKLLVEDAPGVYVYHELKGQLHKPYRKGDHLAPNKYNYDGSQWPGEGTATLSLNTLYMGKDVTTMRK
jgi:ABC-type oligopeptide transport system substrate-binding subunit